MTTWTSDELTRIDAADELEIAPLRRDGTLRSPITIWVVRHGDDDQARAALVERLVRQPPTARPTTRHGERHADHQELRRDHGRPHRVVHRCRLHRRGRHTYRAVATEREQRALHAGR